MSIEKIFLSLLLVVVFTPMLAFAETNLVVETNKSEFNVGEILEISGSVDEKKMPVLALRIFDPDNTILSAHNVEFEEDNTFSKIVMLISPFYETPGEYRISIDYGTEQYETLFTILGNTEEYEEFIPEIFEISSLSTDKEAYIHDDIVTIDGSVSAKNNASVLIGIHDPFGTPVGFYFGNIDNKNNFSVSFLIQAGTNFKIDGEYSIIAHYDESKETIYFDYSEISQQVIKEETPEPEPEKETPQPKQQVIKEETPEPEPEKETPQPKQQVIKEETPEPEPEKETPQPKQQVIKEETPEPEEHNNLSVEDVELGKILNETTLNCDDSIYTDIISYYDGMGPALFRLCKYQDAILLFDQSLSQNPNDIEVLNNKGSALSKLGLNLEAISFFEHALSLNSNYYPALNNKANALSQLGLYSEAIKEYNSALEVNPYSYVVQRNLEHTVKMYSDSSSPIIVGDISPADENNTLIEQSVHEPEKEIKVDEQQPGFFEQVLSWFGIFS